MTVGTKKAGIIHAAILLLLFSAAASADDVTIHNVTRAPRDPAKLLTVTFQDPPAADVALDKSRWTALCFPDEKTRPTLLTVVSADHHGPDFAGNPTVKLVFDREVVNCQTVQVILLTKDLPSQRWTKKAKAETSASPSSTPPPAATPKPTETSGALWSRLFKAPPTSGDPDYSFSGTVVAGVGARPLYTMNGSFVTRIMAGSPLSLAATETVNSASNATIDPDSFNTALTLLYVPQAHAGNVFKFKSNLAGLEFNKQGSVLNEVSSGAFSWKRTHDWYSGEGDFSAALSFTLTAGVEFGDNFKNAFSIAGQPGLRSSGFIFRGVPGAGLAFVVIPGKNTKHAIRWNLNYLARLPARNEQFLILPKNATTPAPFLGTKPRHYLENELVFQINDFFGLKIQHTYGSLPPVFQFVDHRVSTGFVFQASQPR